MPLKQVRTIIHNNLAIKFVLLSSVLRGAGLRTEFAPAQDEDHCLCYGRTDARTDMNTTIRSYDFKEKS